MNVIIS